MSHKLLRVLPLAVAVVLLAPLLLAAEPAADSAEQKVLDRFVGAWRSSYRLPKSEWSPLESSGTADLVADRAVGGKFIQEKSEHSDRSSGTTMLTYDEERRCYRSWWFSSTGKTSETIGQWDAATKTMVWTAAKDDLVSTTRHRFVDDDNAQWSVAIKDGRGKVVFRIEGTSVRSPPPAQAPPE